MFTQPSGLFGAPQPATSMSTVGGSASTTTSAPSVSGLFGAPTTPSFFKPSPFTFATPSTSTSNTVSTSLSSTSLQPNTPAVTNNLFGANNNTTNTNPTGSGLFGSLTGSTFGSNNTFGSSNPFGSNNNAQQQQTGNLLDLKNSFPDTEPPMFISRPNDLTRASVTVSSFMNPRDVTLNIREKQKNTEQYLSASFSIEKNRTLPGFLTNMDNSGNMSFPVNNNSGSKKRALEENETFGRNTLQKNDQGVFARSKDLTAGFDKNLSSLSHVNQIPKETTKNVGVSASRHSSDRTMNGSSPNYIYQTNTDTNSQAITKERGGIYISQGLVGSNNKKSAERTRIRVFGYEQSKLQQVVDYFTKLGPQLEKHHVQKNWITFSFVNHLDAVKAVACNGITINQEYMIGVAWDERAQEVETLKLQSAGNDLFFSPASSNSSALLKDQRGQHQQQQLHGEIKTGVLDKLKEKILWGW